MENTSLQEENLPDNQAKDQFSNHLRNLEPALPFAGMAGFLFVIVGVFTKFAQFPVAGHASWFGEGSGGGVPILILAVLGGLAFASKIYSVPFVIANMTGFILVLEVLTCYDTSAIDNKTVNVIGAPFRLVYDIFRDAFRIGNGAFFVLFGVLLVLLVCFLEFVARLAEFDSSFAEGDLDANVGSLTGWFGSLLGEVTQEKGDPCLVEFVREDVREGESGETSVYRVYRAPNVADAKTFLEESPVTEPQFFLIVETPEGNFCRDIKGIYKE